MSDEAPNINADDNELLRIENEKKCVFVLHALGCADGFCSSLEGNNTTVSEQGFRKMLYQKVRNV